MKANAVLTKPQILENRGDGTYFYNYNIVEGIKRSEDSTEVISFDYDQVIIHGNPTYSKIVSSIVRDTYSSSDELALINNYHRYTMDESLTKYLNEYMTYLEYVNGIKQLVKQDCTAHLITIDN